MAKIPTAEEMFKANPILPEGITRQACIAFMTTFAKLHVEAALKEASEKAKTKMEWWTDLGGGEHEEVTVNKNSIKKSYSLDNII